MAKAYCNDMVVDVLNVECDDVHLFNVEWYVFYLLLYCLFYLEVAPPPPLCFFFFLSF